MSQTVIERSLCLHFGCPSSSCQGGVNAVGSPRRMSNTYAGKPPRGGRQPTGTTNMRRHQTGGIKCDSSRGLWPVVGGLLGMLGAQCGTLSQVRGGFLMLGRSFGCVEEDL